MSRTINILALSMLMNERDTEVLTESVTSRLHKEYEVFWNSVFTAVESSATDVEKNVLMEIKTDSFSSVRHGTSKSNSAGITYGKKVSRVAKIYDLDMLYDYMEDEVFSEILRLYSMRIIRYEIIMLALLLYTGVGFLIAGVTLFWILALLPVYAILGVVLATISVRRARFFFNTGVRFRSHVEMVRSYTIPDMYFSKNGLLPILTAPIVDSDLEKAPVEINVLPVHKVVLTFIDLLDAKTLNIVMKDYEHKELDKTAIVSRLVSDNYATPLKARLTGEINE